MWGLFEISSGLDAGYTCSLGILCRQYIVSSGYHMWRDTVSPMSFFSVSVSPFEQGQFSRGIVLAWSGGMNWTQATDESIFRLTFPAPRLWPSPTSEDVQVGNASIYLPDGSSSWSLGTTKPLHRVKLTSRTELKDSKCNHGSGCGRSGSSAHKLGTYGTLSLNSYSKSTFFFSFCFR